MKTKNRNVEVLSVNLNFLETTEYNLCDVLNKANHLKYNCKDKEFTLRLLDTEKQQCIVGLIETIQNSDIPPKANRDTRQLSPVDIDTRIEGLAYANIFLYDIRRNLLIYEINRNGCYPNQLKEYLEFYWNATDDEPRISITFPAVFKHNEYQRMLNMSRYTKISIELYNPTELIQCYEENSDSIYNNIIRHNINMGIQSNANSIIIQQTALRPRFNPMGLSRSMVKGIADSITEKIFGGGQRTNVQHMRIEGAATDPEGKESKHTIDLIGDSFKESFKIADIPIQHNLQIRERKGGIEQVYDRILPDLKALR